MTNALKEETTEERLARFEMEYEEILANRTEEDDAWVFNFAVQYVSKNAKFRHEYPQKSVSFNTGCAIKDADYTAKDVNSGEEYGAAWSKQFTESADTYYAEWLIYG